MAVVLLIMHTEIITKPGLLQSVASSIIHTTLDSVSFSVSGESGGPPDEQ